MSIEFIWTIKQLDRKSADGFVTTAHYNVSAVDGDFNASTYGAMSFTQEEGQSMTPFAELTQEQVIGWVQDKLGKDVVEASLQSRIDAQKNPVQLSGLPWSAEQVSQGE
jgi:hypothetical protein